MRRVYSFVAVTAILLSVFSCDEKSQDGNANAWQKEMDSLQSVNAQQQMILDDMTSAMADISSSLDTITMHENMIMRRVDENGNPLSRKDLKERLNHLADIIKNQREKMSALETDMEAGKSSIQQLKSVIAYLNSSLEQKEAEVQKLKEDVNSKNFNIARLNTHVSNLQDTIAAVRQENEEQRVQMEQQNEQHEAAMNLVYYIIGTKDQLIQSGVISKSGKIFKKSQINFASINKSVLTKADRRTLKTITIYGKSPKILTSEPEESYSLDKGDASSTLTILNAESFWNTNNKILVIQVK